MIREHLYSKKVLGFFCFAAVSSNVLADFIADSHASVGLRNFYINSDFRDGKAAPSKTEEWAQGFSLKFSSGYTNGAIGLGLDALGLSGIRLDGGGGRHLGGSMIPGTSDGSGAQEWSRLGITGKIRFSNTEVRYGTLNPKLPVLTASDARLLPQTFEGILVTSKEFNDLTFNVGLIDKATSRASTHRTKLAVLGPNRGNQGSDGLFLAGVDYKLNQNATVQYYLSNLEDYYDQNFLGFLYVLPIDNDQSIKMDLRYFRTRAQGANSSVSGRDAGYRVGGYSKDGTGEIDNDTWSAYSTYNYLFHSFTLGYQKISGGSNFIQPNQNGLGEGAVGAAVYLYTDRLVAQFNRAGESTKFGQYSYSFTGWGLPGLTAAISYYSGSEARLQPNGRGDEWERDVFVDYVFQSGVLKGLALSWRNVMYRGDIQRNQDENRLIINYSLSLF